VATLPGATGVLAALLFALDPLLVHFGRIALLETPVMFLLLVSWALLAGTPHRWRLVMAGLFAGLATATKLSVLCFVPAALFSLLLVPPPCGRLRSIAGFGAGLATAGLIWVLMVGNGLPLFLQYTRYYASQQSPWLEQLCSNLASPVLFDRFRHSMPMTAAGFGLAAALVTPALRGRLSREVTLACLWFVLGALYLNTLTYDPLRYYMPLLPAMVILVAWGAVEAWYGRFRIVPSFLGIILCLIFLWPLAWNAVIDLRPGAAHWSRWRMVLAFLIVTTGLAGGWRIAALLSRQRGAIRLVACAAILACIGMNCRAHLDWLETRQRAVFASSRELGTRFTRAVFTGQWAPELCLENQHRAVPIWPGFVNGNDDPFGRYGITHGVIWGRHWQQYATWFPADFARARILDTMWIKDTPVILCEFVSRARPASRDTAAEVARPPLSSIDTP